MNAPFAARRIDWRVSIDIAWASSAGARWALPNISRGGFDPSGAVERG
jgi:hypothetical protein